MEELLKGLRYKLAYAGMDVATRNAYYRNVFDKHKEEFEKTFGVKIEDYEDRVGPFFLGLDIVKFDEEVVKPPAGTSTADYVRQKHGEDAVLMIEELIGWEREDDDARADDTGG